MDDDEFFNAFVDCTDRVDARSNLFADEIRQLLYELCELHGFRYEPFHNDVRDLLMKMKAFIVAEYKPDVCSRLLETVEIDDEDYESGLEYLVPSMQPEVLVNFIRHYGHLDVLDAVIEVVSSSGNPFLMQVLIEHRETLCQCKVTDGVLGDGDEDLPRPTRLLKCHSLDVLPYDGGVESAYREVLRRTAKLNVEAMT